MLGIGTNLFLHMLQFKMKIKCKIAETRKKNILKVKLKKIETKCLKEKKHIYLVSKTKFSLKNPFF